MTILAPPVRPTPLPLQAECIPSVLRPLTRFVGWRYTWVPPRNGDEEGRWTKPPYVATDPERKASSTDPTTWCSFDDAVAAVSDGTLDGVGITLGQQGDVADRIVAVDLDHCITDDEIVAWAQRIIEQLDSYTERSPSGNGIRVLVFAESLPPHGRKRGNVEMYSSGRYVTLTGAHVGRRAGSERSPG